MQRYSFAHSSVADVFAIKKYATVRFEWVTDRAYRNILQSFIYPKNTRYNLNLTLTYMEQMCLNAIVYSDWNFFHGYMQ